MPKQCIQSPKLPRPMNPISQATKAAGFVYTAGLVGRGDDGKPLEGPEAQSHRILESLKLVLEAAGGTLDDVLRCEVHVTDLAHVKVFNEVWKEFFNENPPARCATQTTGLAPGYLIEITAIAYVGN